MPAKINEIGNRYGRLLVIRESEKRGSSGTIKWVCQCDCGNVVEVLGPSLRKGLTQSCGCLQKDICKINEIGNVYGKLTVLHKDETKPQGEGVYWLCKCECGNIVSIRGHHLRIGVANSCGCIKSKGEMKIGNILSQHNISYEKEYSFSDLVSNKGSKLRFDFCLFNKKNEIIGLIEFQGIQHYEPGFKATLEKFNQGVLRDQQKVEYCKNHNIPLLIIPYWDYNKIDIYYILENLIKLKDSDN